MSFLDKIVSIELKLGEAIIIDNFINRQSDFKKNLAEITNEEKQALWNLQCLFESILTEPLVKDYKKTLAEAKKIFSDKK